jgi:hypothetical protein
MAFLAHEVQSFAHNEVWMPEAPPQEPEQIGMISDRALLPPIQWGGDIISRDLLEDEIDNAWPFPMPSSVMSNEAGDHIPHMSGQNGDEEGMLGSYTYKHSI